jgi:hypothetical protein
MKIAALTGFLLMLAGGDLVALARLQKPAADIRDFTQKEFLGTPKKRAQIASQLRKNFLDVLCSVDKDEIPVYLQDQAVALLSETGKGLPLSFDTFAEQAVKFFSEWDNPPHWAVIVLPANFFADEVDLSPTVDEADPLVCIGERLGNFFELYPAAKDSYTQRLMQDLIGLVRAVNAHFGVIADACCLQEGFNVSTVRTSVQAFADVKVFKSSELPEELISNAIAALRKINAAINSRDL